MLNRISLLIVIMAINVNLFAQSVQNERKTTYYLIRHAEKDRSDKTNKDPDLTKKGLERALRWSQLFKQFQIDEVYSTNFKRTLNTALPTASDKNITIKFYEPENIDIQQFLTATKDKSILIVGHSNTTPDFVNKLIGSKVYKDIEDHNNANLYIVTFKDGQIGHVLIKMN